MPNATHEALFVLLVLALILAGAHLLGALVVRDGLRELTRAIDRLAEHFDSLDEVEQDDAEAWKRGGSTGAA